MSIVFFLEVCLSWDCIDLSYFPKIVMLNVITNWPHISIFMNINKNLSQLIIVRIVTKNKVFHRNSFLNFILKKLGYLLKS